MSVANLLSQGRQSSANIGVNSLKYAELTSTERLALTPAEGLTVFDTTLNELFLYAGGAWAQIATSTATGAAGFMVGPTAEKEIATTVVDTVLNNNTTTVFNTGGFTVDPVAGTVTALQDGLYYISAMIRCVSPNNVTSSTVAVNITVNGNLVLPSNGAFPLTISTPITQTCSAVLFLTSGSQIGLSVYPTVAVSAGVPKITVTAIGSVPYNTFLSGAFIA